MAFANVDPPFSRREFLGGLGGLFATPLFARLVPASGLPFPLDASGGLLDQLLDDAVDRRARSLYIDDSPTVTGALRVRFEINGELVHTAPRVVSKSDRATLFAEIGRRTVYPALAGDETVAGSVVWRCRGQMDAWFQVLFCQGAATGGKHAFAVFSRVPDRAGARSLDELGLSGRDREIIGGLTRHVTGLILVAGHVGSGRSTTLAAMERAAARQPHESFDFDHGAVFAPPAFREAHARGGAAEAVRLVMCEPSSRINVGDLHAPGSLCAALEAGTSGHLITGSVRAPGAADAPSRLLATVPPAERNGLARALSTTVQAIVGQRMYFREDRPARVLFDVLVFDPEVRLAVRAGAHRDRLADLLRQQGGRTIADQDRFPHDAG